MHKVLINTAISLSLFFIAADTAKAQVPKPEITLGSYLIYAKPTGDFKKAYSFGGGGEVYGGAGLGKTFIIVTAGVRAFKPQSGVHSGTLTYVPVTIGIKHYVFRKLLFINADLGRAAVKNKNFNESRFTRGFGFGAKLLGLQAAIYYDGWKNVHASGFSNSMNIKVGWSISL